MFVFRFVYGTIKRARQKQTSSPRTQSDIFRSRHARNVWWDIATTTVLRYHVLCVAVAVTYLFRLKVFSNCEDDLSRAVCFWHDFDWWCIAVRCVAVGISYLPPGRFDFGVSFSQGRVFVCERRAQTSWLQSIQPRAGSMYKWDIPTF